ncbi:MAG: PspC domain-containing protein [Chloroflexota bacterium]
MNNEKRLYRSVDDRMIAGICGGLGEYFGIDSSIVRLIFVFGAFFTASGLFWIYLAMLLIVPEYVPASEAVIAPDEQETDSPESE